MSLEMEPTGCCHSNVQHLEGVVTRTSPWGVCQQILKDGYVCLEQEAVDTPRGTFLTIEGTASMPSPVKPCSSSKTMEPHSLEVRKTLAPMALRGACCLRESKRPEGLNSAVGPVRANRWSDSLPINHLPGLSGGLATGQKQQRPACFSSPLRKPLPPTLTQSLPNPPGSLNPPLVSQPPTPTKYLRTLLWSTRTRDYFSTEHTGLGLFWLEHNTDLCQVLAASEREQAGRGSLYTAQENFSPTPNKGVRPCSVHQLCLQYLLSRPEQSLFPRTKKNPPKDQGGPARPDPTLHCLQSQNTPSWLVWRQAAGAAQRASGLCISERLHLTAWNRNPKKQWGFHTRSLEVGR